MYLKVCAFLNSRISNIKNNGKKGSIIDDPQNEGVQFLVVHVTLNCDDIHIQKIPIDKSHILLDSQTNVQYYFVPCYAKMNTIIHTVKMLPFDLILNPNWINRNPIDQLKNKLGTMHINRSMRIFANTEASCLRLPSEWELDPCFPSDVSNDAAFGETTVLERGLPFWVGENTVEHWHTFDGPSD